MEKDFISIHGWTYILPHFAKMDLTIFTTNTPFFFYLKKKKRTRIFI